MTTLVPGLIPTLRTDAFTYGRCDYDYSSRTQA